MTDQEIADIEAKATRHSDDPSPCYDSATVLALSSALREARAEVSALERVTEERRERAKRAERERDEARSELADVLEHRDDDIAIAVEIATKEARAEAAKLREALTEIAKHDDTDPFCDRPCVAEMKAAATKALTVKP